MQDRIHLTVSEPQRLTIQERAPQWVVTVLTNKGCDPHEFATAYTDRTVQLGYAPSLIESAKEFLTKKLVAA